jgi:cytochrome c-type biogenesis protein
VIEQLFTALTHAIAGSPLVALAAALLWGILSIILSPCHLASIPLIIGVIVEQQALTTRRAFWTALVFALGSLVTIGILGIITSAMGRMAGDLGVLSRYVNYGVAVLCFAFGLHLLETIQLPLAGAGPVNLRRKGLLAAAVLGLVYGVALGPCTFAFMIPVLGASAVVAQTMPVFAAGLVVAYGMGHCGVIAAAGTSTELVQRYLNWNDTSPGMRMLKKICGVLVLLGGLYLIYTAR